MLLKWRVLRPVPAEVWVLIKREVGGEYVWREVSEKEWRERGRGGRRSNYANAGIADSQTAQERLIKFMSLNRIPSKNPTRMRIECNGGEEKAAVHYANAVIRRLQTLKKAQHHHLKLVANPFIVHTLEKKEKSKFPTQISDPRRKQHQ